MKKIMLIAFVCVLNLEVWAQTNFRTFGYAEALSVAKESLLIFILTGVLLVNEWRKRCFRRKKSVII